MEGRRKFLRVLMLGAIAPVGSAFSAQVLDSSDSEAEAEHYHPDSSTIDPAIEPNFKPGAACRNCAMLASHGGDGFGRCAIFTEKEVSLNGWCRLYTARTRGA